MKKLILKALACCAVVISLCSFTIEKTLTNEEYGQKLYLYQNGKCVIVTSAGRGSGTYNIEGSTIYFNWDNGYSQQGKYLPNGSQYRSERVCVEGVCYDAGRKVVSRYR